MSSQQSARVGYWMNEKKSRKFQQHVFHSLCRAADLEPVQINLSQPLESQGPFHVILHKLTNVIARANAGDPESQTLIDAFEAYLRNNPHIVVIDPLPNLNNLLDRSRTYRLIAESKLGREDVIFTPPFVMLTTSDVSENTEKLRSAGVTFPFICKPTLAHGSELAHQMCLIFNERGLKDVTPPSVAQSFINHNAALYKLFVIGSRWYCVERPSLKNFYPCDRDTIFFDSHSISKADSDCSLNQLDQADLGVSRPQPDHDMFDKIVSTIRESLQMVLFGIDVVIDINSGKYAIVDINAFPGYDGVPTFLQDLVDHMSEAVGSRVRVPRQGSADSLPLSPSSSCGLLDLSRLNDVIEDSPGFPTAGSFPAEKICDSGPEDSGIDMTDSSDEKRDKKSWSQLKHKHRSPLLD